MNVKRLIAAVSGTALLALPMLGRAATPADGKVTPTAKVTWSGGPLAGSAPSQRNTVCAAGVNCDDFNLDIEVPANAFPAPAKAMVSIKLTTQANQDIRLIISKPGTDDSIGQTNYGVYGATANLIGPQNGVWRIRAACYVCAGATYTAEAKAVPYVLPTLEPQGAFGWRSGLLPGVGQGEPGINVGSDDAIYVNAPAGQVTVWRSFDKGKHWDVNSTIDKVSTASEDSDLAVAADDGTVYVANLGSETFADLIYASNNRGETYTGPAVAGIASDRPWVAAGTNGVVYNGYHDLTPTSQMWIYRSNDHGATFTQVGDVNLGSESGVDTSVCGTGVGHPMVDPKDNDTIYFVYTTGDNPAECAETLPNASDFPLRQLWMAKSTDGGKTFTQSLVYTSKTSIGHFWPADAIDRAGNVYAITSETGATGPGEENYSTHVLMFASKDKGQTWSKPIRVDTLADHHSNVFPAIAAGDAGRVVVAWYTSRATTWFDTAATWTVAFAETPDAFAAAPQITQSRATGVVHVGDVCQSGLFCVFGGNRNLLDFMGVAVAPDGNSYIAYANDTNGSVLDGVAAQLAGPIANAAARKPAPVHKKPPSVLGKKTTLPSTGADAPISGVALILVAVAFAHRLRLRTHP